MILADTSVWIDHFRLAVGEFGDRLDRGEILMHPFVLGELLLSGLPGKREAIDYLRALPAADVAGVDELLTFIAAERLTGKGIGLVDAALLASARLQPGTLLWTLDRRLAAVAAEMSINFETR